MAGPYLLVPHDGDVCLATEKAVVSALKNPGQVYLVCAIGEIIDKLAHDAKILKPPTRGRAKVAVA